MSEWTSVNAALPTPQDDGHMFLVFSPSVGCSDVGFWRSRSGKFLDEPMGFEYRDISHWMPMPESPNA